MALYTVVEHRGTSHWYSRLVETAFETEGEARSAAEGDVDERDDQTNVVVFAATDIRAARTEVIRRGLDWRWQPGQGSRVTGRTLRHHRYRTFSPTWDHDHCNFCWQKFMDPSDPANKPEWFASGEIAAVGYGTIAFDDRPDDYYWVCESCFEDFDPFFHWKVLEGEPGEK